MLSACKTTTKIVEVPVEVIKKEYIHNTKIDSVYIKDSIDRWQKGDTLLITKYYTKYKQKLISRLKNEHTHLLF